MLVLAAATDPRDDGFSHTIPGELVVRPPIVCDAGRAAACGCERSWAGMTTRKGTTLAHVVDRDLTPDTYIQLVTTHLIDTYGVDPGTAEQEAQHLADTARHFGADAYLTIELAPEGDTQLIERLEVSADG